MTSKYLGTSDKNARNGSRKQAEKSQDKDETMTSQIVRHVCYDGSSKQNGVGHASMLQRHLGSDIINLAETFIFVGRIVHILWPKRP